MAHDLSPDCLACGTCCFSTLPSYVRVIGSDYDRLGEAAPELVTFIGNQAFMRLHEGHCAALAIDILKGNFVCSVYANRPAACRDLERGSPACEGERDTKRERPLVALRVIRSSSRPLLAR